MTPTEKALQLMNEARELLGKEPPDGQFDAYPKYLRTKDICEIMQVSVSTANRMMNEPDFPLIRFRGTKRVEREQFFRWITRKTEEMKQAK